MIIIHEICHLAVSLFRKLNALLDVVIHHSTSFFKIRST